MSGCAEALQARSAADRSIDAHEAQAAARNTARAEQLATIAQQGKQAVASAADLRACDAGKATAGIAVDPDALGVRYQDVVDRIDAQLDQVAAQPVAQPIQKEKGKGQHGPGDD